MMIPIMIIIIIIIIIINITIILTNNIILKMKISRKENKNWMKRISLSKISLNNPQMIERLQSRV
jgi:hypothetical protein